MTAEDSPAEPVTGQVLAALRREAGEISVFRLLTRAEIEGIAGYLDLVRYRTGEVVVREGERIDYLGIVAAGKLEATHKPTIGEREIHIASLEEGAHIGDISLPDGHPAMATIIAEEETELLVMTRERFDELAGSLPATAVKILKGIISVLTVRLENAIDRVILFF